MDESVTADTTTTSDVSTTAPDVQTVAPSVHGETLWGGPRWVENATHEPVWVETKQEYWDLLKRHGKQMKDMQESSVRSDVEELPPAIPDEFKPTPPPAPLTKDEARLIAAMIPLKKRYGLKEATYCRTCFTRKRDHGTNVRVRETEVLIACRCGTAHYKAPTGTTDLIVSSLANFPVGEKERTHASVISGDGVGMSLPAVVMNAAETALFKEYYRFLNNRSYETRLYCSNCWDGDLSEGNDIGVQVTASQVVLVCGCRVIYGQ